MRSDAPDNWATVWHPIGGVPTIPLEPDDVKKDMGTLAEHAQKAGRDPKTIRVALKGSLFDKEKKLKAGAEDLWEPRRNRIRHP